jgi:gephyrin
MISSSLKHTPLAALSRPVAGTIKNTLITTLPGSVKAVKENLQALLQAGVVEHAIELIRGGSGRQVHHKLLTSDTLGKSHGAGSLTVSNPEHHHHHHHHHHQGGHQAPTPRSTKALTHDPSSPGKCPYEFYLSHALNIKFIVSIRHRKSPFPQISLESALKLIKENIQRLPVQTLPVQH